MAEETTTLGGLSVPMDVPAGFGSHLEYRYYLGFRGLIQILVTQIKDARKSKSLSQIKDIAGRIAIDSQKFPVQPFPRDLKVWNLDGDGMVVADPRVILAKVGRLVGKGDVEIGGIETTSQFADELTRLM